MKIEKVRVLGKNAPMTLVEIVSDEGAVGIGGADAPVAALRPIIERAPWNLSELLAGADPRDIQRLAAAMFEISLGQGGLVVNAIAALDMALWDLLGKIEGKPLYQLFGGAAQNRVMVYASATAFDVSAGLAPPLQFKSTQRLQEEARARVTEGFKAIKFGWGNHFESRDLERLAAIRSTIGPQTRMMIDFGGPDYFSPGVTAKSAAAIAETVRGMDLFFLEEPLPPYAVKEYAQLTRSCQLRIATGEMLCHGYEFDRFIDARAVDVIQPDAYRIGVTQTLRVARRAHEAGMLCVPHSPWSGLAVTAHLQVLATVPSGIMLEYPSPSLFTDTRRHGQVISLATTNLLEHPPRAEEGYLSLPSLPGLGVGQFNPEVVEQIEALATEGLER